MKYIVADKDGRELQSSGIPQRDVTETIWLFGKGCEDVKVLSDGETKKLIGRKATWDDEPIEIRD